MYDDTARFKRLFCSAGVLLQNISKAIIKQARVQQNGRGKVQVQLRSNDRRFQQLYFQAESNVSFVPQSM